MRGRTAADWAESGIVALTGHPDGPPIVPPGRAATHAREFTERIAVATAGRVRLDGARVLGERAASTGHVRRGPVSAGGSCRLLPTADGWAAVSCARPDDPALLSALVEEVLPADPWPGVAAWLRAHPGAVLAERAELLGVAAAPVSTAPPVPGPPVSGPPVSGPLDFGPPVSGTSDPGPQGAGRDVVGALVVDFSALWAGPLCAHVLGLAGARVVKVETAARLDGARRGNREFYRLLHAGHRSVVVDPTTPAGRAAVAALVAAADIVIEASRPRALEGWGVSAAAAAASGTTWVSITAAGRRSPRVGFGDDVAASAGLVAPDARGRPVFCGDAIADPLTGLAAALAALTAPAGGAVLDVGMAGVVASTLDGTAGGPARRDGTGWVLDTPDETIPVAPPTPRPLHGEAAAPGADTAAVLAELGVRAS